MAVRGVRQENAAAMVIIMSFNSKILASQNFEDRKLSVKSRLKKTEKLMLKLGHKNQLKSKVQRSKLSLSSCRIRCQECMGSM